MSIDEQKALVLELKNGSESAFEKFVMTFKGKIKSIAYYFTRDIEAAEDITQNVFINVFRGISSFRSESYSKLSSWVHRIAINETFVYFRKTKRYTYQKLADKYCLSSLFYCPENTLLCMELNEILRQSIQKLREKEMKVFIYCDVEKMSANEACEVLNLTIPAIKSRLNRGRRKLRKFDVGRYLKADK